MLVDIFFLMFLVLFILDFGVNGGVFVFSSLMELVWWI